MHAPIRHCNLEHESTVRLSDHITVAPRFNRAINLERDAGLPSAIDGYVVTRTAQAIIGRVTLALRAFAGHRAWTLTGPYGSGKSAFALYLATLLGPPDSSAAKLAKTILKTQAGELYRELFNCRTRGNLSSSGFCPIIVTAGPEPLLRSLLRAATRNLKRCFVQGRRPTALEELKCLLAEAETEHPVSSSDAVECIARMAILMQKTSRSQDILIVIDELGKFLEFAAQNPDEGDVYILQQLAEATARFDPAGLLLMTILHQSFERYVADVRPSLRDEWAKVQGRFEDIAFQEPPEQVLTLIGHAISQSPSPSLAAIRRQARILAQTAADLGLAPTGMTKQDFSNVLLKCAPLHPLYAFTTS
jgi:energy-coupling factor transporter ATP-binding protein EcfA2